MVRKKEKRPQHQETVKHIQKLIYIAAFLIIEVMTSIDKVSCVGDNARHWVVVREELRRDILCVFVYIVVYCMLNMLRMLINDSASLRWPVQSSTLWWAEAAASDVYGV